MTPSEKRRATARWIAALVGDRTLKAAAADISAVTGWSLDHSRLSRYANEDGTAHIGPTVVEHFAEYARTKGLPALDLTPPAPTLSLEERAVIASERQADMAAAQTAAVRELVEELRADRMERARVGGERLDLESRLRDLEAQVALLVAAAPSARGSGARAMRGAPAR